MGFGDRQGLAMDRGRGVARGGRTQRIRAALDQEGGLGPAAGPASPRSAIEGSVSRPMNRPIASNVLACEAVASSPDTWVRPAGDSDMNASGAPDALLFAPVMASATFP